MQTPNLKTARAIVAQPGTHAICPKACAAAWADLKATRGQTVNFDRIGPARHIISHDAPVTELAADFTLRSPRVTARIAEIARERGLQHHPTTGSCT